MYKVESQFYSIRSLPYYFNPEWKDCMNEYQEALSTSKVKHYTDSRTSAKGKQPELYLIKFEKGLFSKQIKESLSYKVQQKTKAIHSPNECK